MKIISTLIFLFSYAIGLDAARKTVAGPLRIGGSWSSSTGWGAFMSFGMDF